MKEVKLAEVIPHLPEMIGLLKEANVCEDVSITSNAALLTKEKADEIVKSGLDTIRFSAASLSKSGYKKFTRSRYDYLSIRQKIKIMHSVCQKKEKVMFCKDFSFADTVNIDVPMNWDGSHKKDLTLGKERNTAMDGKTPLQYKRQICPLPWYTLAINFNGKVSICCVDWSYKTIVGDVNKEHLFDIGWGNKIHEFRVMHAKLRRNENPACSGCDYILGLRQIADLDHAPREHLLKNC